MKHLLRGPASLEKVVAWLDDQDATRLRNDADRLSRSDIQRLWDLARDAPPIDFEHFVPHDDLASPVHHAGRNSIPTISRWRRFEKRFARMGDASDTLVGYNEGELRRIIGPGYFLLRRSTTPEQMSRGPIFVDYLSVPEGNVPPGWPAVRPNERGLQRFVYAGTQDFMRKVSERVSVGMPFKGDRQLPFPFVLVRLG